MKNNKKMTAITAVVAAVTVLAVSLSGCGDKHEHVYRWTTERESTCIEQGLERGVCGICGDVYERELPLDDEAHEYGEWQISPPSETATGTATKVCGLSAEHVRTVTLPKVTRNGDGYDYSEITEPATAATEGSQRLKLDDATGAIEFNVVLPRRNVENTQDAVYLGASLNKYVRSGEGVYSEGSNDDIGEQLHKFSYVFGGDHPFDEGGTLDEYTYIRDWKDEDNIEDNITEYWYSLDDEGKVFGVFQESYTDYVYDGPELEPDDGEGEGTVNPDPDANMRPVQVKKDPYVVKNAIAENLLGFSYQSGGGMVRVYGAEDALEKLYSLATTASDKGRAVKYSDDFSKKTTGEVEAEFSFSYYENPFFCRYRIYFKLDSLGMITYLRIENDIIRAYMIAEDENGNKLFDSDGDVIFADEVDDDGHVIGKYSDQHKQVVHRYIEFTNQIAKGHDDVIEDNPYKSDVRYIQDFGLNYDGNPVGNSLTLPSSSLITINVLDVTPTTASLDYDPLKVYIRTEARDIELTSDYSDNPYNIIGFFSSSTSGNSTTYSVRLNSRYAGNVKLVFKPMGGKCEKVIDVEFEKSGPSSIFAQAYEFNEAGGDGSYIWTDYSKARHNTAGAKVLTVYKGQPILIRAAASNDEAKYVDTSFKPYCFAINTQTPTTGLSFSEATSDDGPVVLMTAEKTGEFNVGMEALKTSGSSASKATIFMSVKVVEAPALSEIFKGTYTTTLRYVKIGAATTPTAAAVTAEFVPSSGNWTTGRINMTIGGNTLALTYTYNQTTGAITTERVSGVEGETLDFTFELNEAYRLSITHSTGFGDLKETKFLAAQS